MFIQKTLRERLPAANEFFVRGTQYCKPYSSRIFYRAVMVTAWGQVPEMR